MQQSIPSRAVKTGRFSVKFKVPLIDKELREGEYDENAGSILAQSESVFAHLEGGAALYPNIWEGYLGIKSVKDGDFSQWSVRSAKYFQGTTELKGFSFGEPSQEFWHRDGTRTLPGEWVSTLQTNLDPQNRPTNLRLEIELMKRGAVEAPFSLEVPLPAPGETRSLNQELDNAPLDLRAAINYRSLEEIPGAKPGTKDNPVPPSGVAVVFKTQPQILESQISFRLRSARDDTGRPLDRLQCGIQRTDARRPDVSGFTTVFLPRPAADAKVVIIEAIVSERGPVTQTTKLIIPNMPVEAYPRTKR